MGSAGAQSARRLQPPGPSLHDLPPLDARPEALAPPCLLPLSHAQKPCQLQAWQAPRSVRQLGRKLSGWGHSCARWAPQLRQSLYIPVACATCTPLFPLQQARKAQELSFGFYCCFFVLILFPPITLIARSQSLVLLSHFDAFFFTTFARKHQNNPPLHDILIHPPSPADAQ